MAEKLNFIPDGIFFKVKNRLEKIKFSDIQWIMAKDMYSIIRSSDARFLLSHTLKEIEEKLTPYPQFVRVHRSYIINLYHLEAIEEGELYISKEIIPIGSTYKDALLSKILQM